MKFDIFLTPCGKEKEGLQELASMISHVYVSISKVQDKPTCPFDSVSGNRELNNKLHKTSLFQRQIELIIINIGFQTTLKQKTKSPGARPNYKEKRQTAV